MAQNGKNARNVDPAKIQAALKKWRDADAVVQSAEENMRAAAQELYELVGKAPISTSEGVFLVVERNRYEQERLADGTKKPKLGADGQKLVNKKTYSVRALESSVNLK